MPSCECTVGFYSRTRWSRHLVTLKILSWPLLTLIKIRSHFLFGALIDNILCTLVTSIPCGQRSLHISCKSETLHHHLEISLFHDLDAVPDVCVCSWCYNFLYPCSSLVFMCNPPSLVSFDSEFTPFLAIYAYRAFLCLSVSRIITGTVVFPLVEAASFSAFCVNAFVTETSWLSLLEVYFWNLSHKRNSSVLCAGQSLTCGITCLNFTKPS